MEYLDERFPHPPLMPVYPVARAECRRMMYRVEHDWYSKIKKILEVHRRKPSWRVKKYYTHFWELHPFLPIKTYFLSDEFTLVDCWLAPAFYGVSHC